jgi:hypothetical protein
MHRNFLALVAIVLLAGCRAGTPSALVEPSTIERDTPPPTATAESLSPGSTQEPRATGSSNPSPSSFPIDISPPENTVKLIFIHHSSGENWLADESGGLGLALMQNNYFVSDTNYGWGPDDSLLGGPIGDYTDTGNWWNWFLGPSSGTILQALYSESEPHAGYSRLSDDPGGENEIVMFKSCFPNSALEGNPGDPPVSGDNPLQGQDSGSGYQTVGNAKRVYIDLLNYFKAHPEKLFLVITAPPLLETDTSPEQAANARAFNRWLAQEWLADYPYRNAAVFDFYSVLTSNGGDPKTNDLGAATGNHHRVRDGQLEYVADQGGNMSAYAENGDSHPTAAGNRKATGEFVPLLNYFFHRWQPEH